MRLAIDNNMSARARLVEIVFQQEQTYDIAVGTTFVEDGYVRRNWKRRSRERM